jgi:hypothetical protein
MTMSLFESLKFMVKLNSENLLVLTSFIFASLFGHKFFYYENSSIQFEPDPQKFVAKIIKPLNTVKYKPYTSIAWKPSNSNQLLFDGDKIFTQKESGATIKFRNGHEITMGENSIVKVSKIWSTKGKEKTQDIQIKVETGLVKLKKSAKSIQSDKVKTKSSSTTKNEVDLNDKTHSHGKILLSLRGQDNLEVEDMKGDLVLDVNRKEAKVEVSEGAVTLKNQAGKISLNNFEQAIVRTEQKSSLNDNAKQTQSKIEKVLNPISLVAPANAKQIYLNQDEDLLLKWKQKSSEEYNILISQSSNFIDSKQYVTNNNFLKVKNLDNGTYYWKVISAQSKTESLTRSFKVSSKRAPILLMPENKSELYIKPKLLAQKDGHVIDFKWVGNDKYYSEIQLVDAKGNTQDFVIKNTFQFLKFKKYGKYKWRVRTVYSKDNFSSWSKYFDLTLMEKKPVTYTDPIIAYLPKLPLNLKDGNLSLKIKVKKVPGISHVLILSNDQSFEEVYFKQIKSDGEFNFNTTEVKSIYWKIHPYDEKVISEYEAKGELVVSASPPKIISPIANADINPHAVNEIVFKWERSTKKPVLLEVSKDENFNDLVLKKAIDGYGYIWKSFGHGQFYFRVSYLDDEKNEAFYKLSNSSEFRVQKPYLLPPPHLSQQYESQTKAYALTRVPGNFEEMQKIKWKDVNFAKSYNVQVTNMKGDKLLVDKQVEDPQVIISELMPGDYKIRIASVDRFNRVGNYSQNKDLKLKVYKDERLFASASPDLYYPNSNQDFLITKDKSGIKFDWEEVNDIEYYELIIAKDMNFNKIIKSIKTEKNQVALDAYTLELPHENYFWKVLVHYPDGALNNKAALRSFNVREKPIKVINPEAELLAQNEKEPQTKEEALRQQAQQAKRAQELKEKQMRESLAKNDETQSKIDLMNKKTYERLLKPFQFGFGLMNQSYVLSGDFGELAQNSSFIRTVHLSGAMDFSSEWGIGGLYEFRTYTLESDYLGQELKTDTQNYHIEAYARYKKNFFGIISDSISVPFGDGTDIRETKLQTSTAFWGYDLFSMVAPYETVLDIRGKVEVPYSISSDQADANDIQNVTGYGASVEVSFDKQLNNILGGYSLYVGGVLKHRIGNYTYDVVDNETDTYNLDLSETSFYFTLNINQILQELNIFDRIPQSTEIPLRP